MLHFDTSPVKKTANKPSMIEEKNEDLSGSTDISSGAAASVQDYNQSASVKRRPERCAAEGVAPDILSFVGKLVFSEVLNLKIFMIKQTDRQV